MKTIPYKLILDETEMPKEYLNMKAFMKEKPDPMLNPGTLKPCTAEDLEPVFPKECVAQELNDTDKYIKIPEGIQEYYKMYRPSTLFRAYRLEEALGTPAHIYYKFEGTNTSGSHKLNSAIAQAYYAKQQGLTHLTTETGAGQWGTALSMACSYMNMELLVYMVKCSAMQKPYRKIVMETYGSTAHPSPSNTTNVGRKILAEDPENTGSLGTAISEAVEVSTTTDNCRYALGSVLDQVLLHQSIIGQETKTALEKYDVEADMMIGCVGGGSSFGGFVAPYMADKLEGKKAPKFIAVEPESCPSMTRGKYVYDFCDVGQVTPLAKMYTLGSGFIPSPDHAGGLRYHGMSPILSKLYNNGDIDEVRTVKQSEVFKAATEFCQTEGILPAPESAHAIKVTIDEAMKCKETGEKKNIVFCLTGTGYFDMEAYKAYNEGRMVDKKPTVEDLEKGFAYIPKLEGIQ